MRIKLKDIEKISKPQILIGNLEHKKEKRKKFWGDEVGGKCKCSGQNPIKVTSGIE